jgi:hypothetical protein
LIVPLAVRHQKNLEAPQYHLHYDLIGSRFCPSCPELIARVASKEKLNSGLRATTYCKERVSLPTGYRRQEGAFGLEYQKFYTVYRAMCLCASASPAAFVKRKANMGNQTSKDHGHERSGRFIAIRSHYTNTHLDPRKAAALSARAIKAATRITAARAKAEARDSHRAEKDAKQRTMKQEKERRLAAAEAEAQELKARRKAAEKKRTEQKAREKQEGKEARKVRKRQDERKRKEKEDERGRKTHLQGVAWGFDDRAGTRSGVSLEESNGCYFLGGKVPQDNTANSEADTTAGRGRHRGNTYGVEAGDPGPEVKFDFGIPIVLKRSKKPDGWEKNLTD